MIYDIIPLHNGRRYSCQSMSMKIKQCMGIIVSKNTNWQRFTPIAGGLDILCVNEVFSCVYFYPSTRFLE